MTPDDAEPLRPLTTEVVDALVANYRRFLAFLERRAGSRAAAEEILQSAFARAVEKGIPADETDGAVNWFYAVLRNALTDHYRRRAAEARAVDAAVKEGIPEVVDPELHDEVCACFYRLLPTLNPEYAAILEKVDLENRPVADVAGELGITPNNAGVRLHRARTALRKQLERSCGVCANHGCLECSCSGTTSLEHHARPRTRSGNSGPDTD